MDKIRETKPDTDICENQWERLMIERNLLGVSATRHPMTLFPRPKECGAVEIKRLQRYSGNQEVMVIGIMSDFRKCRRKLDGEEMAFFKLSDSTGEIEVCCFVEAYKNEKEFLKEDTVIKVIGKLMNDKGDGTRKISVCMAERLKPKDKVITVYAKLYLSGIEEECGGFWDFILFFTKSQGRVQAAILYPIQHIALGKGSDMGVKVWVFSGQPPENGRNIRPSAVSAAVLVVRWNSLVFNSVSSERIWWVMEGCVIFIDSAALAKFRHSATARKHSN